MEVPIQSNLYTLSFADDQVVIVQDEEDLSFMVSRLEEEYNSQSGNFSKTEYLTTEAGSVENLKIDEGMRRSKLKQDKPECA